MSRQLPFVLAFLIISLSSCKKEAIIEKPLPTINDADVPGDLKINQLQYLGSHNSYRLKTDQDILEYILGIASILPAEFNPFELDYTHIPLKDQFTNYGIRQIELDLFLDPQGGLFYNRKGNTFGNRDVASGIDELLQPGIKLLHIPDIDFNTHHLTFIDALQEIKEWSDTYPHHIPIFILLELSDKTINDALPNVGFAETLAWDEASELVSLENEILSVFNREEILLPDDVRGSFATLNEAVTNDNWPTIDESRGKVVFLFDNDSITDIYAFGAPNLENKLIFTNANPGDDDAAFIKKNNVSMDLNEIQNLVDQGYLIRTRVDEGSYEARDNDYSKWILGLQSGAHFLSTDYYKADSRAGDGTWSDYHVQFDNELYNLNPITGF